MSCKNSCFSFRILEFCLETINLKLRSSAVFITICCLHMDPACCLHMNIHMNLYATNKCIHIYIYTYVVVWSSFTPLSAANKTVVIWIANIAEWKLILMFFFPYFCVVNAQHIYLRGKERSIISFSWFFFFDLVLYSVALRKC